MEIVTAIDFVITRVLSEFQSKELPATFVHRDGGFCFSLFVFHATSAVYPAFFTAAMISASPTFDSSNSTIICPFW